MFGEDRKEGKEAEIEPRDLVVLKIKQDKLMAVNDLRSLFLTPKTKC